MTELLKYRNQEFTFAPVGTSIDGADTKYYPSEGGINAGPFKEGDFFIKCTAFAGTSLDGTPEVQDPVSGDWFEHTASFFTQLTDVGSERKPLTSNLCRNLRMKVVTVGAGVKTFSIGAILKIM